MVVSFLGGLVLLFVGGFFLLRAALAIAHRFKVSKLFVGMTVVSLATSVPELVVSLKATLEGKSDFAMGNVVGSNIANIGLVLGIALLFVCTGVKRSFYRQYFLPLIVVSSLLGFMLICVDPYLGFWQGVLMLLALAGLLSYWTVATRTSKKALSKTTNDQKSSLSILWMIGLPIGSLFLWWGSKLLISGSVDLARSFDVSEAVIALSMVSVGTSIPELFTSIMAAFKKEKGISLGNVIGSNIFNILAVLGSVSIITPIKVSNERLIGQDIFWMGGFVLLLFLLSLILKSKLDWRAGLVLLVSYVVYICLLIP